MYMRGTWKLREKSSIGGQVLHTQSRCLLTMLSRGRYSHYPIMQIRKWRLGRIHGLSEVTQQVCGRPCPWLTPSPCITVYSGCFPEVTLRLRLVQKGATSIPGRGSMFKGSEAIVTEAKEQETFKQEGQLLQNEEWKPQGVKGGISGIWTPEAGRDDFKAVP